MPAHSVRVVSPDGTSTVALSAAGTAAPDIVVAVTSPEVQNMADGHASALGDDGVGHRSVPIADARDPARTVAEADRLVAILRAEPFTGRRITIDTTGGSLLPMSLMMLRVVAQIGATCTYVSSDFANRRIVPGTQQGHKFDPADLLGAAPAATAVATDPAPAVPATEPSPDTTPPDTDPENPCPPPSI